MCVHLRLRWGLVIANDAVCCLQLDGCRCPCRAPQAAADMGNLGQLMSERELAVWGFEPARSTTIVRASGQDHICNAHTFMQCTHKHTHCINGCRRLRAKRRLSQYTTGEYWPCRYRITHGMCTMFEIIYRSQSGARPVKEAFGDLHLPPQPSGLPSNQLTHMWQGSNPYRNP